MCPFYFQAYSLRIILRQGTAFAGSLDYAPAEDDYLYKRGCFQSSECSGSNLCFLQAKLNELTELNPLFLRDLRKYPNVLSCIRERQKQSDAAALIHFQKGVEEGIFRDDINFDIINQAMSMQFEMLVYSDITNNYPLSEIYSEVTFLHMRGITTPKGMQMVDAFLQSVKEKR